MFSWICAAISVTGFLFFFSVGVITCWRKVVENYKHRRSMRTI